MLLFLFILISYSAKTILILYYDSRKHLTKLRSPVVFCHNDLQEGNILMKENETSGCRSLCLIDYEYCAYNYRGFDIANHFVEWTYDYTNPTCPYFSVNRDLFPSIDQQVLNNNNLFKTCYVLLINYMIECFRPNF